MVDDLRRIQQHIPRLSNQPFMAETQAEIDALIEKGKYYLDRNEYNEAMNRFRAVLQLNPANRRVREMITLCKRKQNEGKQITKILNTSHRETKAPKEVLFTAYYPHKTHENFQYDLLLYAHSILQSEFTDIKKDAQKFKDGLGGQIHAPKTAKQSTFLKNGTPITVEPECSDVEFTPALLTKKWNGKWLRFNFQFEPTTALANETLFMRISIKVFGVEIAYIKLSIEVLERQIQHESPSSAAKIENPIASAKWFDKQSARMYQKIFISYSRKDTEVVEAYRFAQLAIGNDIFMDTYSTRAGENWRAALATAIDSADVFQLFWSENSASSPSVREEWEYALKYKYPETKGEGFIRPVFWVLPMPAEPPNELKHLNFKYVSLQTKSKDPLFFKEVSGWLSTKFKRLRKH
jgi:hypothetical protein